MASRPDSEPAPVRFDRVDIAHESQSELTIVDVHVTRLGIRLEPRKGAVNSSHSITLGEAILAQELVRRALNERMPR